MANNRLQELIKDQRADQDKLAVLQKELEGLRPGWTMAQEEVEQLISLRDACGLSESTNPLQGFWNDRKQVLAEQLNAAVIRRDRIVREVVEQIYIVSNRLRDRRVSCINSFNRWADMALSADASRPAHAAAFPAQLRGLLQANQAELNRCQDLVRAVEVISDWIAKLEEMPERDVPMLRSDFILARAAAA